MNGYYATGDGEYVLIALGVCLTLIILAGFIVAGGYLFGIGLRLAGVIL